MTVSRLWRRVSRNVRGARAIAHSARHSYRPLLAHIVPIRRCNLACGYCNEYDHSSKPVPFAAIEGWLDRLADLGTAFVTCSGGEPLLHPNIVEIIAGIRTRGMLPGLMSNGFLLTPSRIRALNEAGLDYLQISIDNIEPDGTSRKSLRLLDRQLIALARLAEFDVNINTVLGGGSGHPDAVRDIAARLRAFGFSLSVGVIHNATGRLERLSDQQRLVWEEFNGRRNRLARFFGNFYSALNGFQFNLINGRPNSWMCRAGARYLYVSDDGLVGRCSQQRSVPGIPIDCYTAEDVQREFRTIKPCAPYCTVGCAHRVATLDWWLDPFRKPAPAPGVRAPEGPSRPPEPAR